VVTVNARYALGRLHNPNDTTRLPRKPGKRSGAPAERECSAGYFSVISLQRSGCREAKGKLTMRSMLILVAICFSATAFAQSAPPKVGNKSLVQVKPKEPIGCKLVGSVRGTKLWAGDCVGSELRGSTTAAAETQAAEEGPSLAGMEDVPSQPCGWHCRNGSLTSCRQSRSGALWFADHGP
jgi:hypothetical protein